MVTLLQISNTSHFTKRPRKTADPDKTAPKSDQCLQFAFLTASYFLKQVLKSRISKVQDFGKFETFTHFLMG